MILDIISMPVVDQLHLWCSCCCFWVKLNQILVSQNTPVLNAVNQFVMEDVYIACDNCNKWYHKSCIEMHTIVYDCYMENSKLECQCCNCAIKNISFSLFNHRIDSDHLLLSPICSSSSNITTKKAKQLQIMTINF